MCPYHSGCYLLTYICTIFFYSERYFVRNKTNYSLFFFTSGKHVCNQDFIICIPHIFIANEFFIGHQGEKYFQVTLNAAAN